MDEFIKELQSLMLKHGISAIFSWGYEGFAILPIDEYHKFMTDLESSPEYVYSSIPAAGKVSGG